MAAERREIRPDRDRQRPTAGPSLEHDIETGRTEPGRTDVERLPPEEAGVADLVRDAARETTNLVRQELALARLEVRDTARSVLLDGIKIGMGAGFAVAGGLALVAFLVIGLGDLMAGAYWASALIVGVVLLLIGGLMAKRAVDDLKEQEVAPREAIESVKEDGRFAREQVDEFREDIRH